MGHTLRLKTPAGNLKVCDARGMSNPIIHPTTGRRKAGPATGNFGFTGDPDSRYSDPTRVTLSPEGALLARTGCVAVHLSPAAWAALAGKVKDAFNAQLKKGGQPAGRWRIQGETLLSEYLGKELFVLAWALEDAPEHSHATIVSAWLRLDPVERVWLFNQTARIPSGRGRGWRGALQLALSSAPPGEITC